MAGTVTVLGQAVVPAQPDEVELTLEVSHLARTQGEALAEAAKRSQALEGIFDELGIERSRWKTSGVSVAEQHDWEEGKQVFKGYRAENRTTLRLKTAESVGRLMNDATAQAKAQIFGPSWRIAQDNPARVEACRQAAIDARRKAEAYVAALGARLGGIQSVSEPGTRPEPPPPMPMARMALKADAMAAPEITVQAGELDVSATVEVSFTIVED